MSPATRWYEPCTAAELSGRSYRLPHPPSSGTVTTLARSRNGTTTIAGRTSHRARPANAPITIVTPRISSTMAG